MTELRQWFRKRNAFHYHKGEQTMLRYKVLMYDAYGKLQRDFTLGGGVDLMSAVHIGTAAMQAYPGLAVVLDPIEPVKTYAAHA